MNTVDRIDELASQASERPWRSVYTYGSIITDGASLSHMNEDSRRAYGGGLICESVAGADKEFICAVVNAWPQIREALATARDLDAAIQAYFDAPDEDAEAPLAVADAARAKLRDALAPLFGEQALAVRDA